MKKEEFVRNNRGIDSGSDIPKEYLENLYDCIKSDEIQVNIDISDSAGKLGLDTMDIASWNQLIKKSEADQAPAIFTPTTGLPTPRECWHACRQTQGSRECPTSSPSISAAAKAGAPQYCRSSSNPCP